MEDSADRRGAAHDGVGAVVANDVGAVAGSANGAMTTTTTTTGDRSSSLKSPARGIEVTAPTPAPAAGCFLPRTATQQHDSNAGGHAGGGATGGTWREVVEPLCDSAAGGVGSGGEDAGCVAAVRNRSKVRIYVTIFDAAAVGSPSVQRTHP